MTSLRTTAFRDWTRASFVGPVAIALLFGWGVNGFVVAASDPLKVLLILLINRLIRQAHLDMIPLSTEMWWLQPVDTGIVAAGLVLLGTVLGFWIFPSLKANASVATTSKTP